MKLTKDGFEKLRQEKDALLKERVITIEDVKKSREMGDLSENGYYKASKSRLRFIDGQLFKIDTILKTATLIEKPQGRVIGLGSTITLEHAQEMKTYLLVDALEADPKNGKISYKSPLGHALLGKGKGDTISVTSPNGETPYIINEVK